MEIKLWNVTSSAKLPSPILCFYDEKNKHPNLDIYISPAGNIKIIRLKECI